jgi:hypothetical protein
LGAYGRTTVGRPGNLDSHLRATFALSTPQYFAGMVAPSLEEMGEERIARHRRYAELYKAFIRPVLPTCKLYHHAPISARGAVGSSGWFALEYGAADRSKGWALVVRVGMSSTDTYVLVPRGLDRGRQYEVTFDSTGERAEVQGWQLVQEGVPVRLESIMNSELILFEAK